MTTIPDALKLANDILGDFEKLILPDIPGYRNGPRYKEIEQIIKELKEGRIELHPEIDIMVPFTRDEIMGRELWPLNKKLTDLRWMLVELKKKN